jgi:hypothetical protein
MLCEVLSFHFDIFRLFASRDSHIIVIDIAATWLYGNVGTVISVPNRTRSFTAFTCHVIGTRYSVIKYFIDIFYVVSVRSSVDTGGVPACFRRVDIFRIRNCRSPSIEVIKLPEPVSGAETEKRLSILGIHTVDKLNSIITGLADQLVGTPLLRIVEVTNRLSNVAVVRPVGARREQRR